MSEEKDLQSGVLARFKRDNATVAVWLVSGKRLVGRVRGYDRFTILLEHAGAEQIVFKHAISSIGPAPDSAR